MSERCGATSTRSLNFCSISVASSWSIQVLIVQSVYPSCQVVPPVYLRRWPFRNINQKISSPSTQPLVKAAVRRTLMPLPPILSLTFRFHSPSRRVPPLRKSQTRLPPRCRRPAPPPLGHSLLPPPRHQTSLVLPVLRPRRDRCLRLDTPAHRSQSA